MTELRPPPPKPPAPRAQPLASPMANLKSKFLSVKWRRFRELSEQHGYKYAINKALKKLWKPLASPMANLKSHFLSVYTTVMQYVARRSVIVSGDENTNLDNLDLQEVNRRLLRKEFQEGITRVQSFPDSMTLATTTRCNKNPPCVICERNLRSREIEKDLDEDVLKRIEPLLQHSGYLWLHCSGEPLIYPGFGKILKMVKSPTKARFSTNGVLLTEDKIKQIVKSGVVDIINFSLDAATPETYKKIRGAGFERVISNIKRLTRYKKEAQRKLPDIYINMCVMKENYEEMPRMIELAKEVGAIMVVLFHLNHGSEWILERDGFIFNYSEQEKMDPELHDKSVLDAYSKAKELGVEMLFVGSVFLEEETKQKSSAREQISELSKPWVQKTCLAPWSEAVIGYDGNVRVCCYHNEYDEGIGSLRKSTFRDIWNSQKAIDIREQFKKQGFCSHCVKPNSCRYMGRI